LPRIEVSAGLARVARVEGDAAASATALQSVLDHLAAVGTLDRADDARWIEFTCHQALAAAPTPPSWPRPSPPATPQCATASWTASRTAARLRHCGGRKAG